MQEVCEGCLRFPTKPGNEPPELAAHVGRALELDELRECGATFSYPDGLLIEEWAALKALRRGRAKARDEADRRREEKERLKRMAQGR